MFKRFIQITLGTTFLTGAYIINFNKISLKNPLLSHLFQFIENKRPEYNLPLLQFLIEYELLEPDERLNKYILDSGFDLTGKYIEGVMSLGLNGIEIGPLSLLPSSKEQQCISLGILGALSYIHTFRKKINFTSSFKIGLNIVPNYEVIKYTPYLIKENYFAAIQEYLKIEDCLPPSHQLLNYLLLDLESYFFKEFIGKHLHSASIQKMNQEIIKETSTLLKDHPKSIGFQIKIDSQNKQLIDFMTTNGNLINRFWKNTQEFISEQKLIKKGKIHRKEYTLQEIKQKKKLSYQNLISFIIGTYELI